MMPMIQKIKFENGKVWAVQSGIGLGKEIDYRGIVIPIDQIDGLSDSDIAECVRLLIPKAKLCGALEWAGWYDLEYLCRASTEKLQEWINEYQEYASQDESIAHMINGLYEEIERRDSNKPREKTKQISKTQTRKGFVYLLKCDRYYKIGMSKSVTDRIKQLSTQPPFDIELLHTIQTNDMYGLESTLHQKFSEKRKTGEWFNLDDSDIEYIRSL